MIEAMHKYHYNFMLAVAILCFAALSFIIAYFGLSKYYLFLLLLLLCPFSHWFLMRLFHKQNKCHLETGG